MTEPARPGPERKALRALGRLLRVPAGLAAWAFVLLLAAFYIRSGANADAAAASPALSARFEALTGNAVSQALEELAYIPKIYRIPSGSQAPAPRESGFGTAADAQEVLQLLQTAARRLGGDGVTAWTPERELLAGTQVEYYADDSILALVWKEVWNRTVCTFCEVFLSDGSQIRRKLAGDAYGSGILQTATELAAQDNAVASINGDYYAFRPQGTRVWEGRVYGVDNSLDTCFFTWDGQMLLLPRNTLSGWGAAAQYVEENQISFSLAFGPILVQDGQAAVPAEYPVGEIQDRYARSAIGQLGPLHFLLMTSNGEPGYWNRCTAAEAAEALVAHNCQQAYALDGGQTATITLGSRLINRPEFGWQRTVSDILCFASAAPPEEEP